VLEIISTGMVMDAMPEYRDAIRCCVDMELSDPEQDFWVIVPGEFESEGKKNLTMDSWFQPSLIGTTYGDSIPKDWLLVGVFKADNASDEAVSDAMLFIARRNTSLLLENQS
jgi:hypothetical protein